MMKTRHIPLLALGVSALALSACTSLREGSEDALKRTSDSVHETAERVKELLEYHPKPTARKPVDERYCYRVMQDIMCYREPQMAADDRLVAYQGNAPESVQAKVKLEKPPELVKPKEDAKLAKPAEMAAVQPEPKEAAKESFETKLKEMKPLYIAPPPKVAEDTNPTPAAPAK